MAIWKENDIVKAVYKNEVCSRGVYKYNTLVWPSSGCSYICSTNGYTLEPSAQYQMTPINIGSIYQVPHWVYLADAEKAIYNESTSIRWEAQASWLSLYNATSSGIIISINYHFKCKSYDGPDTKGIATLVGASRSSFSALQTQSVSVNPTERSVAGSFTSFTLGAGKHCVPLAFIVGETNWNIQSTIRDCVVQITTGNGN